MPNAYTRMFVPETRISPVTKSTYLRLGSYSEEEAKIVTGLTTTGNEILAGTNTYESDNTGMLAFTNADFQANVEGAALMKVGRGQTTEVTNGNSQYKVLKGTYEISAENGISITAGVNGTPADITLTASNHVNLINKGNKSETTTGDVEKQTMGNTQEFFQGAKFTCMRGATTKLTIARNVSMFLGEKFTYKVSRECSVNLSDFNSITVGNRLDIVQGNEIKQVIGNSAKSVFGPDFKSADSDTKILRRSDFKLAPVDDLKVVGRDGKIANVSVSVSHATMSKEELKTEEQKLVS